MTSFCGTGQFWDRYLTWDTRNPYLTPCFEDTAITWFPTIFILLFALVDIFGFSKKQLIKIPWNLLSITKSVICILLTVAAGTQLILIHTNAKEDDKIFNSETYAPITRMVSYLVALFLLIVSKRAGVRSSGVQSIFWFFAAVCEAILFRTAIFKYNITSSNKLNTIYLFRFIIFPLCFVQFILHFWADSTSETLKRDKLFGKPCPEKTSSYFSKLLYAWYDAMAWKGYKKPLTNSDLWDLNEGDSSKIQVPLFYKYWNSNKNQQNGQQPGIIWVLFKAYGPTFLMGGILKLIMDLLVFISPEILKLLVRFISDPSEYTWKGYLYAAVLLLTALLQTLINAQYNKRMLLIGMRIRTSLSNAVYRKALWLANSVKKDSSVGEIVNLMSVDTQRFMDLMPFIHLAWTAPVQIAVCIYLLYNTLGVSVFSGLAVMILMIPLNGVIAAKIREYQIEQMRLKDDRVKLMGEILSGIKVLKLYAWEPSFQDQIETIRSQEIALLRRTVFLNTSTVFAFTCAPFFVSIATFATFVYTDEKNILDASNAFVALTLFNVMRIPLGMFPNVIALIIQAMVSVKRLNKYLNSEEIDPNAVSHDDKEEDPIIIENGSFAWNDESVTLKDINLRIKSGSLVAVVGTVGSGKSTLLNAILGDLKKIKGRVNTKGTQAYVAQGAWIQNASLRDNILFGDPFNQTKYNRVIQSCSLGPDLQILAAGDETEIGEKGINLSGGQKQRVSLARAAYKESEIYYFDDPLSAVDAHVGKHIFDSLIGPTGILKDTTRVLVTHGISFLPKTDCIVVMKDGMISEMGTYKELLFKKGEFAKFLLEHLSGNGVDDIDESIIQDLEEVVGEEEVRRNSSIDVKKLVLQRLTSKEDISVTRRQSQKQKHEKQAEPVVLPKEKLIDAEKIETGGIDPKVYLDYIKGSGVKTFTAAISCNILYHAFTSYSNIWLSDWSDKATEERIKFNGTQNYETTDLYLGVYGGLGGGSAVAIFFMGITIGLGCLRAGRIFHADMLTKVMRAPMWYFDTTPLGRLINRFAKDVDTADNIIPLNLRAAINISFSVIATIIVISYGTPIFLAFIVPTAVLYFFLQRFYVATSRQLKRLESVSRSPIYSHFSETISGATTIRAFGLEDDFIEASQQKIDYNQKTYFPFIASNLWIALRLESMGAIIILAAALFAIIGRETISPGVIGLTVSYSLQITQLLSFMVRLTSDLETNIVAIERMKETTETPQEAEWNKNPKPDKEWPQKGHIEFTGYQTRYREGLDLVLRGVTCSINPGEKIGIVGRTGAGKSSMTLALFRLVEPTAGKILIDGLDVTSLGLHDLRSKITIIPQDPVLFSGTLRGNLDPFNLYSDELIWNCLELAHLKVFVNGLPEGLFHPVAEEGQNYSVGQRQLVCLARALLRKTKILVLDEATAAVDLETDDLIQKTIRSEFLHSTVVTIAHRINTIMDSTRVLVLDKGEIIEFDTPTELLKDTKSIFYGMAKESGIVP